MEQEDILKWANVLSEARVHATPVAQLSNQIEGFGRSDAYAIQEKGIGFRLARGERLVGFKMGLTSEAKRKQMNLDSPLYGVLTDRMEVRDEFSLSGSIHPKIEPELAFLIEKELPEKPSREQVLQAVGAVCACLEILDSRYQHFKYFSMEDVIADNSSSSRFVLGGWVRDFRDFDLRTLPMQMFVNDRLSQEGNSKDISGDPVVSVIQLCQLLAARQHSLPKTCIVLAGAATAAVALEPRMRIRLEVPHFPNVQVGIRP